MMNWEELLAYDTSLELVWADPSFTPDWELAGPTTVEEILPRHFVFIKSEKFLSRLESAMEVLKMDGHSSLSKGMGMGLGMVVEKKFWESLRGKNRHESLQSKFAFVATSPDISLAMSRLSRPFYDQKFSRLNHMVDGRQMGTCEIHPTAYIAQGVFLGENVVVGKNVRILSGSVVMGECSIGEESILFPNSTLYPWVKVGAHCRIHSGAVIGADGFGYHFHQGIHHKIWHLGGVILEDHVEVGANSAVDGGTFAPTRVGEGSKLDNCVQVGHNCRLGKGVILCGHVAIGGSSTLGDYCVFGGKSGMGSDMTLGKGCQVAGGALVNCDWPDGSVLGGHPARPLKEWMKGLAYVRKESLARSEK